MISILGEPRQEKIKKSKIDCKWDLTSLILILCLEIAHDFCYGQNSYFHQSNFHFGNGRQVKEHVSPWLAKLYSISFHQEQNLENPTMLVKVLEH